jgi:hypothetical protein
VSSQEWPISHFRNLQLHDPSLHTILPTVPSAMFTGRANLSGSTLPELRYTTPVFFIESQDSNIPSVQNLFRRLMLAITHLAASSND